MDKLVGWLCFFLFPVFPLYCSQIIIKAPDPVAISIEHAVTQNEQIWGLMQRKSLPDRHGMLFSNQNSIYISLWSFNCFINLSVAFMNSFGAIQEISFLKAYPEKMDPRRAVNNLGDFDKYPEGDPIRTFFQEHSVTSAMPCNYALEMAANFFAEQNIVKGDVLCWHNQQGFILRTVDLTPHIVNCTMPLYLALEVAKPIALKELQCPGDFVVTFYDSEDKLIHRALFHRRRTAQSEHIPAYCKYPVAKLSIQRL
jgi:uncharacterized membrane protein (UPF0127 family)